MPTSQPQLYRTLKEAQARRWRKLLDGGMHTSVSEIAEAEAIERS